MTNEEKKEYTRRIFEVLDGLDPEAQLEVIGLAYKTLGFLLATAGALDGKERQQEVLTAIGNHLDGIKASVYALCATSIIGGESEFLNDIANNKKEEKK